MHQFYDKLEEALQILRHVEAESADPTRVARIRSVIRQIEETIALANEAGVFEKVPANSNDVSRD